MTSKRRNVVTMYGEADYEYRIPGTVKHLIDRLVDETDAQNVIWDTLHVRINDNVTHTVTVSVQEYPGPELDSVSGEYHPGTSSLEAQIAEYRYGDRADELRGLLR